jgi:hypothetical protein
MARAALNSAMNYQGAPRMAADRRLFYLLLRALGLYLLVEALRTGVEQFQMDFQEGLLYEHWIEIWSGRFYSYSSAAVLLGAGGYLFFAGRWILEYVAPFREGKCWDCAYDLRGNVSGRCPECGRPAGEAASAGCAAPLTKSLTPEPPWVHTSAWGARICLGLAAMFFALCILNWLLIKYELITRDNCGGYCFAQF